VLKKIFGSKKEENEENYVRSCIICLPIRRRMRQVGHVVRLGDKKNGYRILVGKTDGKKTLEQAGVDGRINQRVLERERGCVMD